MWDVVEIRELGGDYVQTETVSTHRFRFLAALRAARIQFGSPVAATVRRRAR